MRLHPGPEWHILMAWHAQMTSVVLCVRCSAGVGRTGVFCALSILIDRLKSEAVVDVFQTVKQLREQRPAMVQTKVRASSTGGA